MTVKISFGSKIAGAMIADIFKQIFQRSRKVFTSNDWCHRVFPLDSEG